MAREKVPGVYIQTHPSSGAFYIGANADVHRAVIEDVRKLNKKCHYNEALQDLFNEDPVVESKVIVCRSLEEARQLKLDLITKNYSSPSLLNKRTSLNVCAVYRLTHVPTGQYYIGSTQDFNQRRYVHEYSLRKGKHMCQKLQEFYDQNPDPTTLRWDVIHAHPRSHAHQLEEKMIRDNWNDPLLLNKSMNVKGNDAPISEELREKRRAVAKQLWAEGRMRDPSVSGASKKVSIDGNIYDSVVAASKQLNLATHHIYRRVKSDEWPSYQYL